MFKFLSRNFWLGFHIIVSLHPDTSAGPGQVLGLQYTTSDTVQPLLAVGYQTFWVTLMDVSASGENLATWCAAVSLSSAESALTW